MLDERDDLIDEVRGVRSAIEGYMESRFDRIEARSLISKVHQVRKS